MKKIISTIASLALCAGTMTAITANALNPLDVTSEMYQLATAGFHEIDDYGELGGLSSAVEGESAENYKIYISENYSSFLVEIPLAYSFSFTVKNTEDTDLMEDTVKEILKEFNTDYQSYYRETIDGNYKWFVYDETLDEDIMKNVRDICSELKEQDMITDFYFTGDLVKFKLWSAEDIDLMCYKQSDIEKSVLEAYIAENNLDCTVVEVEKTDIESDFDPALYCWNDCYWVKPNYELTPQEYFDLERKIGDDLGIGVVLISPVNNDSNVHYDEASAVDIYNINFGDVNSDNAITASDAAMVLSYYAQGQTGTVPASAESDVDYSIIADYNNDGAVTAVDAALILSDYAEGQIS